ncbi:DUF1080 domain-containing protein [Massilia sp. METH4]|uniref:3-keto-disaccharide hydrolase n=1 Tax=Massilia sp. METH4 TaxID=3123041 RepID=UPI0030D28ED3
MRFRSFSSAALVAAMAVVPLQATAASGKCNASLVSATAPLTGEEKLQGWTMLWDGSSTAAWRSVRSDAFPAQGWQTCDGILTVMGKGGEESRSGGDIITRKRYRDFELELDVMIAPGANSGVKIFTQPDLKPIDRLTGKPATVGSAIGLEFQVLDDDRHPDAKLGIDGNRTIGSLYDLIPAAMDKSPSPVEQWNRVRIVSKGKLVSFWLNGKKTVEFERGSDEFRAAVAGSKFKDISAFGEWPDGHILLQDHGDKVSFRNIRIRDLSRS